MELDQVSVVISPGRGAQRRHPASRDTGEITLWMMDTNDSGDEVMKVFTV